MEWNDLIYNNVKKCSCECIWQVWQNLKFSQCLQNVQFMLVRESLSQLITISNETQEQYGPKSTSLLVTTLLIPDLISL